MPIYDRGLVWLRRDLRLHDHAALHHALKSCRRVWCAFIFDRDILDPLLDRGLKADRRVDFIRASLVEVDACLRERGSALVVRHDRAEDVIPGIAAELGIDAVFVNHDYEPAARRRDSAVAARLSAAGRTLLSFKDQVIFEKSEVLTSLGRPFSVFTPYKNAWLGTLMRAHAAPYDCETGAGAYAPLPAALDTGIPALAALGFTATNLASLDVGTGMSGASRRLECFLQHIGSYADRRDFPALEATSSLSTHLRFGTISIRGLVRAALAHQNGVEGQGAAMWLSELVWREFFFQILYHHPRVAEGAFKPEYDRIVWETGEHAEALFAAWCAGRTGYPLVDAAMTQLNRTGAMHNRLRMVVANFLIKDLGIDWRRGEQYFADRLNDFELASNNGGWQWAASTGCDAQPYFRIFNPVTQSQKFDPEGQYIKTWLPQLSLLTARDIHRPWRLSLLQQHAFNLVLGKDYPHPLVNHEDARARTLRRYALGRQEKPEKAATGPT